MTYFLFRILFILVHDVERPGQMLLKSLFSNSQEEPITGGFNSFFPLPLTTLDSAALCCYTWKPNQVLLCYNLEKYFH